VGHTLPDLLDVPRLVDAYGFHPDVVTRWFRTGELAGFKIGKRWFTTLDDWQAFIDARRGVDG
jgi:hypothetical protein